MDATAKPEQKGSSEVVLSCSGLTKDFTDIWGRPTVRALEDLNLTVRRGEIFGLLGPNGSGKTTTIKLVLGLLFPTSGVVRVLGADPRDVDAKQRIGYLPEESYLHRFLNAEETLDFYGRLFDLPAAVRRERAAALIERVGLKHARRRLLGEYSKGMVRRVGLAQCLINDPELVLLDEPTSGMDPIGSREIKDLILDLKKQGKTVLLSSHLLADVEDVCDRIAMLYRGRLQLEGSVSALLETGDVTELAVKGLSDSAIHAVQAEAEHQGGQVLSAKRRRERLEALFMRVVEREQGKREG
jgi:ABC-2 type transport system ATP-binding protein